jgi:DNA-binding transcriptional ArsR family regulator
VESVAGTSRVAPRRRIFNHMVERQATRLDRVYGALADETRRAMIARLARGTCTIGELAEPLPMSFAAASKHVGVLERAGLVRRERSGREHRITLNDTALTEAADWATRMAAFWTRRLDQLEDFLKPEPGKNK